MPSPIPTRQSEHINDLCNEIDQWVGPQKIYPISFSIPEHLILTSPPSKTQQAGSGISRGRREYTFTGDQQDQYYADYQRSYFGLTYKKGGWDCMRHLEIMANACLPYFPGIADCPRLTLAHYPKALMREIERAYANRIAIEGYELNCISPESLNTQTYNTHIQQMLDHIGEHLSTQAMARYLLKQMRQPNAQQVLYITRGKKPDYVCDLLFHGLRSILGRGCIDAAKISWMYNSMPVAQTSKIYGCGFTYSRHLSEIDIDRANIKQRIAKREFDLIVFGSVNRCHDLLPHARRYYDPQEIALIDGEDSPFIIGYHNRVNEGGPRRSRKTARQLPLKDIVKQGIYFKRELDHAVLMDYGAALSPASIDRPLLGTASDA